MKKALVFVFALGAGISAAFASGSPECYAACRDEQLACLANSPHATGACQKVYDMCKYDCDFGV
ncbi:hypothetical protein [Massilia endophytica]|uniref:hypothetical protein n=1 Tax=Massilia endophytica TaxID=2899220 RepID=UPI001E38B85B|nr:hypothetical protein [Massilia endophytica]UGQ47119.1 hypothetical protein LSQ66_01165 [Massilia endophytica]